MSDYHIDLIEQDVLCICIILTPGESWTKKIFPGRQLVVGSNWRKSMHLQNLLW